MRRGPWIWMMGSGGWGLETLAHVPPQYIMRTTQRDRCCATMPPRRFDLKTFEALRHGDLRQACATQSPYQIFHHTVILAFYREATAWQMVTLLREASSKNRSLAYIYQSRLNGILPRWPCLRLGQPAEAQLASSL